MLIYPSGTYVTALGGEVNFNCLSVVVQAQNAYWYLNGLPLEEHNRSDISISFEAIGNGIGLLRFSNVPVDLNGSRICCAIQTAEHERILSIECTILLLQGYYVQCIILVPCMGHE